MSGRLLNVCLLNDSFPPILDGVANVMLNYANIIHNDLGASVVVVPHYPGESYDYPFPVIHYPSVKTPKTGGYRTGLPYPGIIKDIKRHPIDIIHCHCPFVSSVIAKSLKRATGAPIIMTYHTKYDIDIANIYGSPIIQSAIKKIIVSNIEACDEVWAVSNSAGENLGGLGYSGGYRVMDNGVDFPKGPAADDLIREVSLEFRLPQDMPVFLYVGRMMWYKGIKITLEGLQKAKAQGARFVMVFTGGGADLGDMIALAHELGLDNECIFTGSVRSRDKLRALYSRADMFLFPSTFDSAPISVREASACGLASVLIRGSSSAEPVTDGRNAVLIDEDAESLAGVIVELTGNPEKMKELGRHAMDDLYLPWGTVVKRAYERYGEVLDKLSV